MSTNTQTEVTFEQQVNDVASKMTQGEDGNWEFPEDLDVDDNVKFAANLERRRRDTQAAYGKNRQETEQLRKEKELLLSSWEKEVQTDLTQEQKDELEELKNTDLEAWRAKINHYEANSKTRFSEKATEISEKAAKETELQRRERLLNEFNEANPDIQITDDDVPPRYLKELEQGETTFEEFLEKCKKFLGAGKVVGDNVDEVDNDLDMNKLPGDNEPSKHAKMGELSQAYDNTTF